jgi:hypothetical protein
MSESGAKCPVDRDVVCALGSDHYFACQRIVAESRRLGQRLPGVVLPTLELQDVQRSSPPDTEAACPDGAARSGYEHRRPGQAAAGWPGPATAAGPLDATALPRSNANARGGIGPPRRRCPATRGRRRARPSCPSPSQQRCKNSRRADCLCTTCPRFPTKATSPAAQLSPDATTTNCR